MAGRGKSLGKLVATVRMYIPAGMASPSPPLGPALGQVQLICCMDGVVHCILIILNIERSEYWIILQGVQ